MKTEPNDRDIFRAYDWYEANDTCKCATDAVCDDGLFCTGSETCDATNIHDNTDPDRFTVQEWWNDILTIVNEQ